MEDSWPVPAAGHWVSADVHVHMNYGGQYRNTPAHLVTQALAENLGIVNALIVNKEQRFPDIAYNGVRQDPAPRRGHCRAWTGVSHQLLGTSRVARYRRRDIAGIRGLSQHGGLEPVPTNADVADIAHARGAVVGYVHPFDEYPEPLASRRRR